MRIRAFITMLLATFVFVATPQTDLSAANRPMDGSTQTVASSDDTPDSTVDDDTTRPTINDFIPEDRQLSDCLSSLPKPNCGSDAQGGWRQTVVFLAMLAALAFIAWRIVAASRRARRDHPPAARDRV